MGGYDAPSRLLLCPARPESTTALPGAGNPGNAGRSGLNAKKKSPVSWRVEVFVQTGVEVRVEGVGAW
jgi:hypothetical protein